MVGFEGSSVVVVAGKSRSMSFEKKKAANRGTAGRVAPGVKELSSPRPKFKVPETILVRPMKGRVSRGGVHPPKFKPKESIESGSGTAQELDVCTV